MKSNRSDFFPFSVVCCLLAFQVVSGTAGAVQFVQAPPLSQQVRADVGNVQPGQGLQLPLITWGGDIATILANGNAVQTAPGSLFAQKGLSVKLVRQDDFKQQIQAYLNGDTPYLRGTLGMLNMAAEVLNKDPRTRPVVIYQMTWSTGGDCLVVKPGIGTAKDLRGKTVALQAYGPHVDYLAKMLADAGLSMSDVTLKWVPDLTGTDDTPAQALFEPSVDAALVIIPDGLALTSNGTVGTGAEGSVQGARILLSTKTANRIIADVYAVRSDYFEANRPEVEALVHGLMLAAQQVRELFRDKEARMDAYKSAVTASARILLDSPLATADAEALYGDCEFVDFPGNVKFFGDEKWPRNLSRLTDEIQSALVTIGLLGRKWPLSHAQWDYDRFRPGLAGVDDVPSPRFKQDAVAQVVAKKQAMGTLGEGELFSFEINFQPNQNDFSQDLYSDSFKKVAELAATYGGAIITVEGHSDPHKYQRLERKGAAPIELKRTQQAAKNLSMNRAIAVRDSIIGFAENRGVPLDSSQFTVIGHGIDQPKYVEPKTKEQWLSNMRVVFRIIQIEAEADAFVPLD